MNTEKCTNCKKIISSKEFVENGGYCKECMDEIEKENIVKIDDKNHKSNIVASIIKVIAFVEIILGIILCFMIDAEEIFLTFCMIFISSVFVYAIGEIIALLQRIADNTERN